MNPRSPAAAIAWEFQRRYRWALAASGAYLLAAAALKLGALGTPLQFTMDDAEMFALMVAVPLSCMFFFFLAVFTFGLSGDLAARQSMYPARMLTLPMSNAALAGWPMLYGAVTITALWFAMRFLGVWPLGETIPLLWPALLGVSLLAWSQAFTWMPYPVVGLRVLATVLWLAAMETIAFVAVHFKASEPAMIAILAPQPAIAYLIARSAVARARRGDIPQWNLGGARTSSARASAPFASAASAQAWFEWRRHGLTLPTWVALLLPAELLILWAAGTSAMLVFIVLFGVLFTPPVMAAFSAATVRPSNPDARDALGVSPFIATRPVTSAALIAAKLKMTLWSTALTWLVVFVATGIALYWSGTIAVVEDRLGRFAAVVGTPRAIIFVVLVVAVFVASTWRQLVQTLWIGMSGREGVVKASLVGALLLLSAIGPVLVWIMEDRRVQIFLWHSLPIVFAVLVALKMTGVTLVAVRLARSTVLSQRTLILGAATWTIAVLTLYGVLVWWFSTPHVPRYVLMLVAILLVPLARVSAAPLALAWNRHR